MRAGDRSRLKRSCRSVTSRRRALTRVAVGTTTAPRLVRGRFGEEQPGSSDQQ